MTLRLSTQRIPKQVGIKDRSSFSPCRSLGRPETFGGTIYY